MEISFILLDYGLRLDFEIQTHHGNIIYVKNPAHEACGLACYPQKLLRI